MALTRNKIIAILFMANVNRSLWLVRWWRIEMRKDALGVIHEKESKWFFPEFEICEY